MVQQLRTLAGLEEDHLIPSTNIHADTNIHTIKISKKLF